MFRPKPIIGRHMKHKSAACDGRIQRSRIAQIARDALDIQVLESGLPGGTAPEPSARVR